MKIQSSPQDNLLQKLQADIDKTDVVVLNEPESTHYCEQIRTGFDKYFPYQGSVKFLPYEQVASGMQEEILIALNFLNEVFSLENITNANKIVVVWDDMRYVTLKLSVAILFRYFPDFLSIPAHMYIVPLDCSWCICFRIEGDVGYGVTSNR